MPEEPAGEPSSNFFRRGHPFPVPANEWQRARAVDRTGLLDTAPECAFDSLTWIAGEFLATPISLLTLQKLARSPPRDCSRIARHVSDH
jgi:hypothetical protein